MPLRKSGEDYLEAILVLQKKKGVVRSVDVAQLLTQMYSFAIREEIATTNFAKFIPLPDQVKKEKEIFSQADIEKLKKEGSDAAKIILMLIGTGMRIGELFSLPLSGYHQTYVIGGSKTDAGRNRIIPIRPEARDYFAHFAAIATGPLLLSGYSGQRVADNFRNREYYPLLKKLKIKKIPSFHPAHLCHPGYQRGLISRNSSSNPGPFRLLHNG